MKTLPILLLFSVASQATPLPWVSTKAEAFSQALATGKHIVLLAGSAESQVCGLVRNTLCNLSPCQAILAQDYVLWYCNTDTNSECLEWAASLSFAMPMLVWIDPTGPRTYDARTFGLVSPSELYYYSVEFQPVREPAIASIAVSRNSVSLTLTNLPYGRPVVIERCADFYGYWTVADTITSNVPLFRWREPLAPSGMVCYRLRVAVTTSAPRVAPSLSVPH